MSKFTNGDVVEVVTKGKTLTGVLLESSKKEVVTIKLSSGYNIGINKKNIDGIRKIKKIRKKKMFFFAAKICFYASYGLSSWLS